MSCFFASRMPMRLSIPDFPHVKTDWHAACNSCQLDISMMSWEQSDINPAVDRFCRPRRKMLLLGVRRIVKFSSWSKQLLPDWSPSFKSPHARLSCTPTLSHFISCRGRTRPVFSDAPLLPYGSAASSWQSYGTHLHSALATLYECPWSDPRRLPPRTAPG
jgi:hypothetical protein